MSVTGYSGTPLIQKLGIKKEMRVRLINPPDHYFELLGADISQQLTQSGEADWVHMFVTSKNDLIHYFASSIAVLSPNAIIWISWYKKSAKIPTDITEDAIRELVLPTGWVDVKVCAVDELWSGLKIVKRRLNR